MPRRLAPYRRIVVKIGSALLVDRADRIWLGTYGGGLNRTGSCALRVEDLQLAPAALGFTHVGQHCDDADYGNQPRQRKPVHKHGESFD